MVGALSPVVPGGSVLSVRGDPCHESSHCSAQHSYSPPIVTYEKDFRNVLLSLQTPSPLPLAESSARPLGCSRLFSSFTVSLLDDKHIQE